MTRSPRQIPTWTDAQTYSRLRWETPPAHALQGEVEGKGKEGRRHKLGADKKEEMTVPEGADITSCLAP